MIHYPTKRTKRTKNRGKTQRGSGTCKLFNGGSRSKKHKRRRTSKTTKKSNTNRKRRYFHFLSL